LPPEEQQRLREEFRRYRDQPPGQRDKSRERWQQLTPEEREQAREKKRRERAAQDDRPGHEQSPR
jgi:hypothetical protein